MTVGRGGGRGEGGPRCIYNKNHLEPIFPSFSNWILNTQGRFGPLPIVSRRVTPLSVAVCHATAEGETLTSQVQLQVNMVLASMQYSDVIL